ncbi:MAG: transglutaminase-like domain-containing protein, partial [Pseudonocardia sp.]|nr:transglutaminase-like domain-containing protein [Pseudonocardia sp.]
HERRIAEIAAEVTAGADDDFDRAMALQQYFTGPDSVFTYDLATAPPAGDDALVEFLTVGRVGYCEQFASAMAVMLRTVGVPSRVAVGFTAGVATADYRSISTADAHAWVEAWFPGIGWTTFDPTPLTDGRAIVPPYVEQALSEAAGGGTPVGPDAAAPLPPPAAPSADPAPQEQPGTAPAAPPAGGAGAPLWPFALLLLVPVVGLAPTLLRRHTRRTRLAAAVGGGPAAAGAAWEELLAESADRGSPTPPTDTVRGAARRLVREHRLDLDTQNALREVVSAVESSWFGDRHPAPHVLGAPVQAVRSGIASGTALTVRARLLPRSVVNRSPVLHRRGNTAGHDPAAHDDTAAHDDAAASRG